MCHGTSSYDLLLSRQITNWKMLNGKAVNQSKAKHCRAANEVAGEGHAGRPPSCRSLLLKQTVKTDAFHLSWIKQQRACSLPLFNPKSQTQYESAACPSLSQKWAFDHSCRVLRDVFKEDSKRNYVGSVRLTPEKSFALMALRALASTHWADTEMNTGD